MLFPMFLTPLDWAIVAGMLVLVLGVAAYTQRLNRSVADFLSANRCAGRYLLTLAMGMSTFGAIAIVADFLQNQFFMLTCLVVTAVVVVGLGWDNIMETLRTAPEPGKSLVNPFDQGGSLAFQYIVLPDGDRQFRLWLHGMAGFTGLQLECLESA
jgi:hypothetical protein